MINYVDVYNNKTYELKTNNEYMLVTCPENKFTDLLVQKGDLIFTPSSETIDDIGMSALVVDDLENTVYSYHVLRYRTNEKLDFLYKKYLCNNHYARNYFSSKAVGTVRKTLSRNDFKNLKVALPPIDDQVKIAEYLDKKCADIDAVIAAKEKTNELLKEHRQSIITEVVTKGLNPDVSMKDSGIEWVGKIPDKWNTVRLRSRFSFGKGLPITKADLTDAGIGVISYGQIHSKFNIGTTVKLELIRYVDKKYLGTNEASLVRYGDFIFADTSEDAAGCGNCVYVDVDYPLFAGYHTMILRYEGKGSSKYYSYLFATDAWRSQIRAQATGVKLFSITQKMLRDALLIEPSEEEKEHIVAYLDEKCSLTDAVISANETTIKKLKEYRQSIIYEAVTGKTEI